MSSARMRSLVFVLSCSLLGSAVFADGVAIDHDGIGCVAMGKFPQLFARFDPADAVSRARLHFRPSGYPHWYSVPMKEEGLNFVAVLPKPDKGLTKFDYYISATDKSFNESRTQEYSPDVVSGPAGCQQNKLLASALTKAKAVLVNPPEGIANVAKVPTGFSSDGVIGGATTAATGGAGAATGAAAAGAAAAGGGLSGVAITGIAVAGAGAVAGGVALATKGSSPPPTTLPIGTFTGTLGTFTETVTASGTDPDFGPYSCAQINTSPPNPLVLTITDSGGTGTYNFGGVTARVTSSNNDTACGSVSDPPLTFPGSFSLPVQVTVSGAHVSATTTLPPQKGYPTQGRAFTLSGSRSGSTISGSFTEATVIDVAGSILTFSGGTFTVTKQ